MNLHNDTRNTKLFLLIPILFAFLFYPFTISKANCPGPSKIRAISTKVLQKKLKDTTGSCSNELLQLAGLNQIIGYVVDEKNNDLILIGEVSKDLPPLYLEDFVIALRNAFFKYASLENNVYQFSFPGCSIDPNPQVVKELEAVGEKMVSGSTIEENEKGIGEWKRICEKYQNVRIIGIPFNTHFAKVMVKADYDMKLIVDGSDTLDIQGFKSLPNLYIDKVRDDIIHNKPLSISMSMNRFWFCPGENRYEEDTGVVMIKQCPVTLLTNETYLSKNGQVVDADGPDPLAKTFANNFSALYDNIAYAKPIYRELENIFRLVALANIIKYKSSNSTKPFDFAYLLEHYPIEQTPVEMQLPGRSNVKQFSHRQEYKGGYSHTRLWIPSCGGVDAAIKVTPEQFERRRDNDAIAFRNGILQARHDKNTFFWDLNNVSVPILSEYKDNILLQNINRINQVSSAIILERRIVDSQSEYLATDGKTFYRGKDIFELTKSLARRLNSEKTTKRKDVQIIFKGFAGKQKIDAFTFNLKNELSLQKIDIKTKFSTGSEDNLELKVLFTPGTISKINLSKPLKFEGMYKLVASTTSKIGQKIIHVTITVIAKTAALARTFMNLFEEHLTNSNRPISLIENVSKSRQKMFEKYKDLNETDLLIETQIECAGTIVVELDKPENSLMAEIWLK